MSLKVEGLNEEERAKAKPSGKEKLYTKEEFVSV